MARKRKDGARQTAGVKDYSVLKAPVITEKSSIVKSQGNTVVFKVDQDADKTAIRQAVERIFGVEVAAVRTCNFLGKLQRTSRSSGRRAGYKKAYVTLKEGQTIDIVEGL